MKQETLIEKIEKEITNRTIIDKYTFLFRSKYNAEKITKTFLFDKEKYQIITYPVIPEIIIKLREYAEKKWNDGFSTIKYEEEPIKHQIRIYEKLQEIINIPKIVNYKIKGTYLEDKIILTEIPHDMMNATEYCKIMPKTLTKIIAEYLSKMHLSDITYRDPSIYTVMISPTRKIISLNNLIFTQPMEKIEDKARDIMQFLISLHYNSKKPIDELTSIFKLNYTKYHNKTYEIKEAMKNIIEYDNRKLEMNPIKEIYHLTTQGFGQYKLLILKKIIEKTF
ncbi:MAG: hypothetical protein KatS3mg002_0099 [Candidatus Woesearchaeota archaeon]|nr:MAG: hypothetical protein KatS3mg002_0099 [Candidatus Woesearchaeota archaeon]